MKSSIFFGLSRLIGLVLVFFLAACQKDITGLEFNPDIPVPEFLSASEGHFIDKVGISWQGPKELYYQLYRSASPEKKGDPISAWEQTDIFYDEQVQTDEKYYYRARASTDADGLQASAFTQAVLGYSREGWTSNDPVDKPTTVRASKGDYTNKVKVTWEGESGHFFRIYRSTSSTNYGSPISEWRESKYFNDYDADQGVKYYYRVRAASSQQGTRKSKYSSYSSGWLKDSETESPDNIDASDGEYDNKVKVTWDGGSASFFKVYRSISQSSNGSAISGWIGREYYNDYDAEEGITYYYRIKAAATSSGGDASDFSFYDEGYKEGSTSSNGFGNGTFNSSLITETSQRRYAGRNCQVEINDDEVTVYVDRTLRNGSYTPSPKDGDVGYISSRYWEVKSQNQNSKTWELRGSGYSHASVWLPVNVVGTRITQMLSIASGATMTLKKTGNSYELTLQGAISTPYQTSLEMVFTF